MLALFTRRVSPKRCWTILLAGSLAAAACAAGAAEFRKLGSPEIKARFGGMEFTDEVHWAMVFGRDGSLSSFEMGATAAAAIKSGCPARTCNCGVKVGYLKMGCCKSPHRASLTEQ